MSLDELRERWAQLHQSPEYQASCQHFTAECARLESIARDLYARREELQAHCDAATVRKEYASCSTLHRGFYCPSPVFDLIVGNTHRGKLLKRITKACKPSHEYGFDANGRLLYCKSIYMGHYAYTEYLVYNENTIYGLNVDRNGSVSTVTEEIYAHGTLQQFQSCLCLPTKDGFCCQEIDCESYEYDNDGLYSCVRHHLIIPAQDIPEVLKDLLPQMPFPIYRRDQYQFERKEGFLTGYTNEMGDFYPARFQRKA